jgi:hypothetical protein
MDLDGVGMIIIALLALLGKVFLFVVKIFVYIVGFIPILLIRISEWLSVMPHVWPFPNGFL